MENEKTFTQEELDSIIEGRLARERQKYADYEDLRAKASKSDALQAKLTALEKVFSEEHNAEADGGNHH